MNKLIIWLAASSFTLTGTAVQAGPSPKPQVSIPFVSLNSKGDDVRVVLHRLFEQGKKNFVLDGVDKTELFLSLDHMPFDEALTLVCRTSNLSYEIENGIYTITAAPRRAVKSAETSNGTETPDQKATAGPTGDDSPVSTPPAGPDPEPEYLLIDPMVLTQTIEPATLPTAQPAAKPAEAPKLTGRLPLTVLKKSVTGKWNKTDLRVLLGAIGTQANVKIVVDDVVPKVALDFYLGKTSLGWALNTLAEKLKLQVVFTDEQTILLKPKSK